MKREVVTDRPQLDARMDDYREDRIALPESWHSVTGVVVRGTSVYYHLGFPRPLRDLDGRYHRDERGRVALEAFLGLPFEAMFDRLETYRRSLIGGNVEDDPARYRDAFRELVSFVETFGPFGFDWGQTHQVLNLEADRLAKENWQLSLAAAGIDATGAPPSVGTPIWRLVFPELGQPFLGQVDQVMTYPELAWDERVRLGDPRIPHDDVGMREAGPFAFVRRDLLATVRLADAVARRDRFELRDLIRTFPRAGVFDVRDYPTRSAIALDWRTANLGLKPADGLFRPFEVHETQVDWVALGRMILVEQISLQLLRTSVGVGLAGDVPVFAWRIGSLLEVIYLQLYEHIRQHPDFGIGACDYCGAPILRVRRLQRWHSGCAPAGRQRESRAARKAATSVEPDV